MKENNINPLDYFAGGVPAGAIFDLSVSDIKRICEVPKNTIGNTLYELSLIGLLSYFESFCKDQFSSIINIVPSLIDNLNNIHNTTINATDVIKFKNDIHYKIGFIITEKYDFGSAKKINSLYQTLIKINPFSKTDIKKYDDLLCDRNLLVHHGGIYSSSYIKQNPNLLESNNYREYYDSIKISKDYLIEQIKFLHSIVIKIVNSTYTSLNEIIIDNQLKLTEEEQSAIKLLKYLFEEKNN